MACKCSSVAGSGGQHAVAGTPGTAPSQYSQVLLVVVVSVPPGVQLTERNIRVAPAGTGTNIVKGTFMVATAERVPVPTGKPGPEKLTEYVCVG